MASSSRRRTISNKGKKSKASIRLTGCGFKLSLLLHSMKQQKKRRRHGRRGGVSSSLSSKIPKGWRGRGRRSNCWSPAVVREHDRQEQEQTEEEQQEQAYENMTYTRHEQWSSPPGRDYRTCSVCGGGRHKEFFCPYSYVDGALGLSVCGGNCRPEQHLLDPGTGSHRHGKESLRRFVRVTNVPRSLTEMELGRLLEQFGPLLMCGLTPRDTGTAAGLGFATFICRDHAEKAIDMLNGHRVHGCKLRVDWAYPRA